VKEAVAHPDLAVQVHVDDRPGVLAALTRTIYEHGANVSYVGLTERAGTRATIYFELENVTSPDELMSALGGLNDVTGVEPEPTFGAVFGKRVIVIGGGAQVTAVVSGAVNEADRHNIRGERISVDTIPLVGEHEIAEAVRATVRLPRVRVLVLAGSLMGGEITDALKEAQAAGIVVMSLRQAGSVPGSADLVVTDPVQAGTMAVMLIASTARLDIAQVRGRTF